MGWRDRDYNRGGSTTMDFFGSPWSILSWSLPLGNWFGIRVRMHFWLVLAIVFDFAAALSTGNWIASASFAGLTVMAIIFHEFGHRIMAQWVGGRHDDFMLWPAGGMVPPLCPPQPWPTFVANVGGIAANILICAIMADLLWIGWHIPPPLFWNPLAALSINPTLWSADAGTRFSLILMTYWINAGLILVNFLPFYWFDGGPLLQSILWRWTGLYRAIDITCIVGMIIAVPMAALAIYNGNIMGLLVWAMLFFAALSKRRHLQAQGPEELETGLALSVNMRDLPTPKRRKLARRWFHWAVVNEQREVKDQIQIDAILAKVHDHGLHSLTWFEKRALRRATARQRQREDFDHVNR